MIKFLFLIFISIIIKMSFPTVNNLTNLHHKCENIQQILLTNQYYI